MPKVLVPPFAERVRRRMSERGLGLRELCRSVELDPSFFSKVLAGKRSPPSDDGVLRRIARLLELDACDLIVSAGRIPGEWSRLWTDRPLLDAVDRLCKSEALPASRAAAAGSGERPPERRLASPDGRVRPLFGDELL